MVKNLFSKVLLAVLLLAGLADNVGAMRKRDREEVTGQDSAQGNQTQEVCQRPFLSSDSEDDTNPRAATSRPLVTYDEEAYKALLNDGVKDMTGKNLRGAPLSGKQFEEVDFSGADLSNTQCYETEFINCTFDRTVCINTKFIKTQFKDETVLANCQFNKGSDFSGAKFTDCKMHNVVFCLVPFIHTVINKCSLNGVFFIGSQCDHSKWQMAMKPCTNFFMWNSSCKDATFEQCNFSTSFFGHSNVEFESLNPEYFQTITNEFRKIIADSVQLAIAQPLRIRNNFSRIKFHNVLFTRTNLDGLHCEQSEFSQCKFIQSNVLNTIFEGITKFMGIYFSSCELRNLNMQFVEIQGLLASNTLLFDINFAHAKIKSLCLQNPPRRAEPIVQGPGEPPNGRGHLFGARLNFTGAELDRCLVLGEHNPDYPAPTWLKIIGVCVTLPNLILKKTISTYNKVDQDMEGNLCAWTLLDNLTLSDAQITNSYFSYLAMNATMGLDTLASTNSSIFSNIAACQEGFFSPRGGPQERIYYIDNHWSSSELLRTKGALVNDIPSQGKQEFWQTIDQQNFVRELTNVVTTLVTKYIGF